MIRKLAGRKLLRHTPYRGVRLTPSGESLALKLVQFPEVVAQVAQDCFPNQLCLYLYELAGIYMRFYEACPVLKAEPAIRNSRLGLCHLTARTIQQGLALLGIETLEKM